MGAEEPLAGGVDLEVAGGLAAAGGVLEEGERAGGGVAGVDHDGVVATVGAVDELAARVDLDLGGGVSPAEILRQGGSGA